jgi:hypothetical protein
VLTWLISSSWPDLACQTLPEGVRHERHGRDTGLGTCAVLLPRQCLERGAAAAAGTLHLWYALTILGLGGVELHCKSKQCRHINCQILRRSYCVAAAIGLKGWPPPSRCDAASCTPVPAVKMPAVAAIATSARYAREVQNSACISTPAQQLQRPTP